MAAIQNTSSYVKFVRGTRAAWEALMAQPNSIHDDTLYFIYETAGASTGILYLGTKQIGGMSGEMEVPTYLSDLEDVLFEEGLSSNDILIYNGNKWINGSVKDVLLFNENVLSLDDADQLTLLGFTAAQVGTIPQKNEAGKLTWVQPGNLSAITEINNKLQAVYTKEEVNDLFASVDHLSYVKVENLEEIDLQETNKIYLVPTNEEDNQYNEYMVIDGELEPVGKWSVDLNDYVTTTTFNTKVAELNQAIATNSGNIQAVNGLVATLQGNVETLSTTVVEFKTAVGDLSGYSANNTLVEQVNHLTEQLTWQEIVE